MGYALSAELPIHPWFMHKGEGEAYQPTPTTEEPQSLIAQAQAGDDNAFNQLVVNTQQVAYQTAYRLLQSEEAADDAVQDAFIKAYRALATYRGGSFKSWFLRILINTCYDRLRQQKRQATTSLEALVDESAGAAELIAPVESPDHYAERRELHQWLERGLATLPIDQRTAVVLVDIEGYAYNDLVAMTGVPLGTAKSRLSRGRNHLRDYLVRHRVLAVE